MHIQLRLKSLIFSFAVLLITGSSILTHNFVYACDPLADLDCFVQSPTTIYERR